MCVICVVTHVNISRLCSVDANSELRYAWCILTPTSLTSKVSIKRIQTLMVLYSAYKHLWVWVSCIFQTKNAQPSLSALFQLNINWFRVVAVQSPVTWEVFCNTTYVKYYICRIYVFIRLNLKKNWKECVHKVYYIYLHDIVFATPNISHPEDKCEIHNTRPDVSGHPSQHDWLWLLGGRWNDLCIIFRWSVTF